MVVENLGQVSYHCIVHMGWLDHICDTQNSEGLFFFFFILVISALSAMINFQKLCEKKMPSSGIWLDSRLIYLSIESKNTQNGLRTRKLWSSEVAIAELIP